jgi:hypothetical protein
MFAPHVLSKQHTEIGLLLAIKVSDDHILSKTMRMMYLNTYPENGGINPVLSANDMEDTTIINEDSTSKAWEGESVVNELEEVSQHTELQIPRKNTQIMENTSPGIKEL